jgi:hypothetical protein
MRMQLPVPPQELTIADVQGYERERYDMKLKTLELENRLANIENIVAPPVEVSIQAEPEVVPPLPTPGPIKKKRFKKEQLTLIGVIIWVFVIGLIVGNVATNPSEPTLEKDYSTCISNYTYNNPIDGNPHQTLVNALYDCGIYNVEGPEGP